MVDGLNKLKVKSEASLLNNITQAYNLSGDRHDCDGYDEEQYTETRVDFRFVLGELRFYDMSLCRIVRMAFKCIILAWRVVKVNAGSNVPRSRDNRMFRRLKPCSLTLSKV